MSIWKKLENLISGDSAQEKSPAGKTPFSAESLDPLEYELNAAGRISLSHMQKLQRKFDQESFCKYVKVPVLILSLIHI